MNRLLLPLFAASAVLVAACGGGSDAAPTPPPASAPYPVGLSNQQITVNGVVRQYRVHVPAALTGAPKAVVLVLHGGGGEGLNVS
ncbi:MAG: hypothetical protein ACK54L_04135, partial [Betaproteobacteria bacterium]